MLWLSCKGRRSQAQRAAASRIVRHPGNRLVPCARSNNKPAPLAQVGSHSLQRSTGLQAAPRLDSVHNPSMMECIQHGFCHDGPRARNKDDGLGRGGDVSAVRYKPPGANRAIPCAEAPGARRLRNGLSRPLARSTAHQEILTIATLLARHSPGDPRWQEHAATVAGALLTAGPLDVPGWVDNLEPVGTRLTGPLQELFTRSSPAAPELSRQDRLEQRHLAAAALGRFLRGDQEQLTSLLVHYAAGASEFSSLLEPLSLDRAAAARRLRKHAEELTGPAAAQEEPAQSATGQTQRLTSAASAANGIVALLLLDGDRDRLRSSLELADDRCRLSRHRPRRQGRGNLCARMRRWPRATAGQPRRAERHRRTSE